MNKRGIASLRKAASVLFDHAQMAGDSEADALSYKLDLFADNIEIDMGIRPVREEES